MNDGTTRPALPGRKPARDDGFPVIERTAAQYLLPDEKRRNHAARRDAVCLDEERSQDQEDRESTEERLEILPHIAEAGLLRNGARLLSAPRV